MANKRKIGLAAANKETRERVASEGGKASHGGGRKKEDEDRGLFGMRR